MVNLQRVNSTSIAGCVLWQADRGGRGGRRFWKAEVVCVGHGQKVQIFPLLT